MAQRQSVSPAVYVDPQYLLCGYCGKKVQFSSDRGQAVGMLFSTQIWCENAACPEVNVVGDVPITSLPGSKHRSRGPQKNEPTEGNNG